MTNPSDPNGPYGQPGQPGYGYPPAGPQPGYGAPPPGYGAPPPGYAAPPPGYGTQPPGYGAAQQNYGTAGAGYPPAGPGYGYQQPGFGPPAPYAHWFARVGGYLIDALIVGVPLAILYGLAFGLGTKDVDCSFDDDTYGSSYSYSTSSCTSGGLTAVGIILMLLAIAVGLALGLWLIYQEGTTGQTPGKKVVGIRVIREADGQVLGFGMAFVRKLCHILDNALCGLGYLWPLWDEKNQTFADKIVGTIVVQAQQ
ncbi:putative RDD family membrane protein YckC [Nocardia kruczakiae]|uniref:RDD family membrane protein YckC n=1 Tax=Nocardia kruczakiae TaxID=261477 RepID=A0ABU1XIX5_9NOCA|nr:RDD family protein [Nocardia kruczakiae]MDR7170474.1 putative RDD family membrane protein YckC [Nocardia kruczakiae]